MRWLALRLIDARLLCSLERQLEACLVALLKPCRRRVLLEFLMLVCVLVEMNFSPSLTFNVSLHIFFVRRFPLAFMQSLVLLKYVYILLLLDRLLGCYATRLYLTLRLKYHLTAHHALLD